MTATRVFSAGQRLVPAAAAGLLLLLALTLPATAQTIAAAARWSNDHVIVFRSDGRFADYDLAASRRRGVAPTPRIGTVDRASWPGLAPHRADIVAAFAHDSNTAYILLRSGQCIPCDVRTRAATSAPRPLGRLWPDLAPYATRIRAAVRGEFGRDDDVNFFLDDGRVLLFDLRKRRLVIRNPYGADTFATGLSTHARRICAGVRWSASVAHLFCDDGRSIEADMDQGRAPAPVSLTTRWPGLLPVAPPPPSGSNPTAPMPQGPSANPERARFVQGEPVLVKARNLNGQRPAAVTVAKVGAPQNVFTDLARKLPASNGTMDFGTLPIGAYEVRLYLSTGSSWQLQPNPATFTVSARPTLGLDSKTATYSPADTITVEWKDFPGDRNETVIVCRANRPRGDANGMVMNPTRGTPSSSITIGPLVAGAYEARAFWFERGVFRCMLSAPFVVKARPKVAVSVDAKSYFVGRPITASFPANAGIQRVSLWLVQKNQQPPTDPNTSAWTSPALSQGTGSFVFPKGAPSFGFFKVGVWKQRGGKWWLAGESAPFVVAKPPPVRTSAKVENAIKGGIAGAKRQGGAHKIEVDKRLAIRLRQTHRLDLGSLDSNRGYAVIVVGDEQVQRLEVTLVSMGGKRVGLNPLPDPNTGATRFDIAAIEYSPKPSDSYTLDIRVSRSTSSTPNTVGVLVISTPGSGGGSGGTIVPRASNLRPKLGFDPSSAQRIYTLEGQLEAPSGSACEIVLGFEFFEPDSRIWTRWPGRYENGRDRQRFGRWRDGQGFVSLRRSFRTGVGVTLLNKFPLMMPDAAFNLNAADGVDPGDVIDARVVFNLYVAGKLVARTPAHGFRTVYRP